MGQKKPNKGKQQPERTPQEDAQLQQILAQYRQIAQGINKSKNEAQIEVVLAPIIGLPEASQIGLLKALAKEETTAAADIVLAMNTYAPLKEVRKEARRSLIYLEGKNTYAQWAPPAVMSLADALGTSAFDDVEEEILDGEDIIEHFLEHWFEGEHEAAYDLLATTSPLRDGLTRDEWVARRRTWAAEARPARIQIDVGYALEVEDDNTTDALDDIEEELDAFWSLEMHDVASSSSIPELPTATIIYQATGRHWFWARYTFIIEDDELRIHSIRDMGGAALQLPAGELEHRIHDIAEEIHGMSELLQEEEKEDEDDQDESDDEELGFMTFEELTWFTKQSMHYCDALIAQAPQEDAAYELASQQAVIIHEVERAAAYFERIAERFPEQRGEALRSLGMACTELTIEEDDEHLDKEEYLPDGEQQPDEVASRFLPLAEQAFRDAITTDNAFMSYILLAELFTTQNTHTDEAQALFEQAQALAVDPKEKATAEAGKARLAHLQNKPEEALTHYQHAAELAPDMPSVWYNIGEVQLALQQKEAAAKSFLRSTELDPTTTDAYADLATLYIEQDNDTAALEILQQGLDENPFAADLMAAQAMLYITEGDLRKAEELIEEAEETDPEMEIVQVVRQIIDMQKAQQRQQQRSAHKKSHKSKKRR
ncbi:MAG: hypothetical protein NVS4B11_06890 [Ktedonobacteraceae bacterium]